MGGNGFWAWLSWAGAILQHCFVGESFCRGGDGWRARQTEALCGGGVSEWEQAWGLVALGRSHFAALFCWREFLPQGGGWRAGLAEALCGGWGEWEQVWGLAALGGSDFAALFCWRDFSPRGGGSGSGPTETLCGGWKQDYDFVPLGRLNMPPVALLCAVVHTGGRAVMNCFPAHASISGSSSLPKLRVVPPIRMRGCFFCAVQTAYRPAHRCSLKTCIRQRCNTPFRHTLSFPEAAVYPNSALYRRFGCAAAFYAVQTASPRTVVPHEKRIPGAAYTFPAYVSISRRKADYPECCPPLPVCLHCAAQKRAHICALKPD